MSHRSGIKGTAVVSWNERVEDAIAQETKKGGLELKITVEFDSLEEFTKSCTIGQKAEEPKMLFKEPLTAEEAVKALNAAAAEAVESKADSSEDKPKKAKAVKGTPKAEKPAPEAPEVKEDALREAFYTAMKAGKKDEVKSILAEYGVGRVSEIPKDKRAEAIEKAKELV